MGPAAAASKPSVETCLPCAGASTTHNIISFSSSCPPSCSLLFGLEVLFFYFLFYFILFIFLFFSYLAWAPGSLMLGPIETSLAARGVPPAGLSSVPTWLTNFGSPVKFSTGLHPSLCVLFHFLPSHPQIVSFQIEHQLLCVCVSRDDDDGGRSSSFWNYFFLFFSRFPGRAPAIMKVSSEYLSKIRVRFKTCRQLIRPASLTTTTTTAATTSRLRLMTALLLILLLPRSLSAQGTHINSKCFKGKSPF